jgi:hypothetical protein
MGNMGPGTWYTVLNIPVPYALLGFPIKNKVIITLLVCSVFFNNKLSYYYFTGMFHAGFRHKVSDPQCSTTVI